MPVPEWGGTVRVRGLSGKERDQFEASMLDTSKKRKKGQPQAMNFANLRAKLCAWCVVDVDGARMFSDSDIAALGEKSAAALDRIFEVAQTLSGISDDDVEELAEDFVENPFDTLSSA